jgi:ATP-dependent exoDNAse (exonuclease V) beta subunit
LVKTAPLNAFFTDEQENILRKNREEEKRLLYVGFTRARDYLFLVSCGNNFDWFEDIYGLDWKQDLNINPLEFMDENEDKINTIDRAIKIVKTKNNVPLISEEKYFLAPSREPMEVNAVLRDPVRLGNYMALQSNPQEDEEANLGNLFHQFFVAQRNAKELIESYNLSHLVNKWHLEESFKRLKDWTDKVYPGAIWHCEWPVTLYVEGQMIQGSADLILELPDSLILIDHKSYPGGGDKLHKNILEKNYTGQLAWYKKALDETNIKKVSSVYLHFPISSALVQVLFES